MSKSVSLQEGSCKEKHALRAGEIFEKLDTRAEPASSGAKSADFLRHSQKLCIMISEICEVQEICGCQHADFEGK